MSVYVLDTDVFTLLLRNQSSVLEAVSRHQLHELFISIITVEEIWNGWQHAIRKARLPADIARAYERLTETLHVWKSWSVLSFGVMAIQRYSELKQLKLNVGTSDMKIASIALDSQAIVVTANIRDYQRIPGLTIVDWTR